MDPASGEMSQMTHPQVPGIFFLCHPSSILYLQNYLQLLIFLQYPSSSRLMGRLSHDLMVLCDLIPAHLLDLIYFREEAKHTSNTRQPYQFFQKYIKV